MSVQKTEQDASKGNGGLRKGVDLKQKLSNLKPGDISMKYAIQCLKSNSVV